MSGVAWRAYRYQGRFLVQAPAEQLADRIANTVGTVEAIDGSSCLLETGSNSLDELLLYIGVLGYDFEVLSPPELVAHVQTLITRLTAAV